MKKFTPLALAVACANLAAQQQPPMEHVLVSVPMHKKAADTALPVTVLSGDDLRRQASSTIGDTLSNSPGLANASFGPGVGQPVIRGQAGPRVTVLQNGTSSADAANISADHAASVEPLLAQSVEVLRGPATLLYGGGAIGGVVNVLDNRIPTRALDGVETAAEYRHDSASSGDTAVARLDAGNGRFIWHLDALYRDWDDVEIPGQAALDAPNDHDDGEDNPEHDSEGLIENSNGRTNSVTAGGAWHFTDGFFGLAINRLENNYGIPPGAHSEDEGHSDQEEPGDHEDHDGEEHGEGEEPAVRLDVEQTRYDAALHLHEPLPALDVFRGFFSYTDYQHSELEGAEIGTRYSNETWETRLELVHTPWGKFHGSFGLQARAGEFSAVGEEAFIPLTDSSEVGLFVVEDYHSNRWTVEGGLRAEWAERDPDSAVADKKNFSAYSVSGSAQYDFSDRWQLGLSLMRAERAPAIEELFSNVDNAQPQDWVVHAATRSIELGDPTLDTEVSSNVDLTLSWLREDHYLTINAFYNDFGDYIALQNSGLEANDVPVYAYANQDAQFYGVEVDSEFTVAALPEGKLLLNLGGDSVRGELDSGNDVPRLPPRRVSAKVTWDTPSWRIHARILDAARQDRPGPNEAPTAGYTRLDAGVEYNRELSQRGLLVLFVNLNNITDQEIRLSTSFLRDIAPEPGMSVQAGVRLAF